MKADRRPIIRYSGEVSQEADFIRSLLPSVRHPAARALADDTALLEIGGARLVLTHDVIVEGVHFLSGDPPEDIGWKLVAVNVSDLAAKGARPVACLLGYALAGDAAWDRAFAAGLLEASEAFGLSLIGGDTVSAGEGTPRSLGLTAIGEAGEAVPSRAGAGDCDLLWVSGTIGDAGAGLGVATGELGSNEALLRRYRRPRPRLEAGQALAPLVTAMMDISDGLLIDARRMAAASGLMAQVELEAVPLSSDYLAARGEDRKARLAAVTAGDDYELLFAAPQDRAAELLALSERLGLPLSRVGRLVPGHGLRIFERGEEVPLPDRLGYEHGSRAPV